MRKSPFKLLEAYGKEDKEIFFGRDEETEALYQMSFHNESMRFLRDVWYRKNLIDSLWLGQSH